MKYMNSMRFRYATFQNDGSGEGSGGGTGSGDGGSGGGTGGDGSGGAADWRAALPENVRGWDEFKNADTPEAAFERIEHMRTKFGTGLFAPGKDASQKDWTDFYGKLSERTSGKVMPRPEKDDVEGMNALFKQLGRPEDAAGYEFAEGTDSDTAAAVGKLALDNNLSVAQMKGLDEGMAALLVEQGKASEAQRNEGLNTLKGEWGAAWDERSKIAEKVRENFLKFIPADQMNAGTMAALYEVGKALGGEGSELLKHEIKNEPTLLQAKEEIEELSGRIAELQKSHDGSKRSEMQRLVLQRRALYKKAFPGGGFTVGGKQVSATQ